MALNGGSTRSSWHSTEGAQDSHGTQSMEGARGSRGTQWREHKIPMALNGGSTSFSWHSMEGAQDSRGTQWRERERIGADVVFYLTMLRYSASANYAAPIKPAFHYWPRSHQTCSTFTLFFSSMTSSRHRSSTIQPNGYASRFAELMSPQQEQNPQEAASSRHKHQPPLQEMPSYSSQLKSALAQKASPQDSDMTTRVR
ncbi:unnamed protein product [Penicillium nalgiovense]|nr:unnamed protein product [Penicillium nalgiovense]